MRSADSPSRKSFSSLFRCFQADGTLRSFRRLGSGHINDTWLLVTDPPDTPDYVLQRINHHIFKNIQGLMDNIHCVTSHMEKKLVQETTVVKELKPLRLIPAINGRLFYQDEEGNYWRMFNYISGSHSYDVVTDPLLAYEGGKAFGLFQWLTSDINPKNLTETIPYFHHIEKRLDTFHETIRKDPVLRVASVRQELDFVIARQEEMKTMLKLCDGELLPLRVTHNDTKFNNILFNRDNKAICIVDLDTVMPGYVLFDFGDAIRTGANTGNEDEKELKKVCLDIGMFEAYTRGYLETAKHFLTIPEIDNLAFSSKFMTFIIGLRFLTDHIDGDRYYRIHYENHNLYRARSQFRLLESMEENFGMMKMIVKEIAGSEMAR